MPASAASHTADPPPTRFILLSTQRSGTSWVMERLAAHPRVGSYGELLMMDHEGWSGWPPGAHDRPVYKTYLYEHGHRVVGRDRHRHLFAYLDYVFVARRGYEAVGFKMMYDQVKLHPATLAYIRSRKVRVLHLVRTNLVDIALSQIAMTLRRSPHAWSAADREDIHVSVDPTELLRVLRRLERQRVLFRATIRTLGVPTMEVEYEALRASDAPLRETLRFLNVEDEHPEKLQATMIKLAPDSHQASIANYDHVERCLRGTRFAHFLRP